MSWLFWLRSSYGRAAAGRSNIHRPASFSHFINIEFNCVHTVYSYVNDVNDVNKFSSIEINIKYFWAELHTNLYSDVFDYSNANLKWFMI